MPALENPINLVTVTIAAGQTKSNMVALTGMTLCGVYPPATTVNSAFTLNVSPTATDTPIALTDSAGNAVGFPSTAGKPVALDVGKTAMIEYLQIEGASAETNGAIFRVAARSIA